MRSDGGPLPSFLRVQLKKKHLAAGRTHPERMERMAARRRGWRSAGSGSF